jgi:hypothetical protein
MRVTNAFRWTPDQIVPVVGSYATESPANFRSGPTVFAQTSAISVSRFRPQGSTN